MLPTLYQLTDEYLSIQNTLLDAGVDDQTLQDTLEGASGELEQKCSNVAMVIRNMEATADQIAQAIATMQARQKALTKRAEWVNEYLHRNMERCGISKIDSPWFSISIKKNPPKVVIEDEGAVPQKFFNEKVTYSIDKAAIKEAINNGEQVTGAHIEQGTRLEIK